MFQKSPHLHHPPHSLRREPSPLWSRLRAEDGISLVIALGVLVVLTVLSTAAMAYTRSNQHNAVLSQSDLQAKLYAESGLHAAYSLLARQSSTGGAPSSPTLLGCAA